MVEEVKKLVGVNFQTRKDTVVQTDFTYEEEKP